MDEFDSGDELFDDLDENELLQQQLPNKRSLPSNDSNMESSLGSGSKRPKVGSPPPDAVGQFRIELARRLLNENFGHPSFKHAQEAAITQTLAGKNVLVIFPTGAGKSLCYQIPALAFEEMDNHKGDRAPGQSGVSIIVSPLIALMKDQVDTLRKRGIAAECIDSTKTAEQQREIRVAMRKGQLRLLYCAPERLNNEGFIESLKDVAGGIRLVAIDEAHCISEWGHSFRPDYLKVARFVQEVKAERVVCLTATATPRVAEDVCKAFNIDDSCVFRTPLYRPNLSLYAEAIPGKQDKFEKIFTFLHEHPGSTLIYVTLQKQAEMLAEDLRTQGFDAQAFHAGMKTEEKQRIQDEFMSSRIPIVVATIAFGMGIDKSDIRNIIHFDLSGTVEEYSQQIGRAGRDGKPSNCMFYICPDDYYLRENFARGDLPSLQSLKDLLNDIFNPTTTCLSVGEVFGSNHYTQSRDFDIRQDPLRIIYATLELHFGLFRAITPEYTQYTFEATPSYFPVMKADASAEGRAVFHNAVKKAKYHHIDVNEIARAMSIPRIDLIKKLNALDERGCIKLKASGLVNRYRILSPLPATPESIDHLATKLHSDLVAREEDALRRVQEVTDLITGPTCYARALAEHFGMKLPDARTKCGHCTVCLTGARVVLPPKRERFLDMAGVKRVLQACDARDDPRFLARVAFGIKSPRVTRLGLDKKAVFGSLADQDFKSLLSEFTRACEEADHTNSN